MTINVKYKFREVSTADLDNDFDPPLVFSLRHLANAGWQKLIEEVSLLTEANDVDLSAKIIAGIAFQVTDGSNIIPIKTEADALTIYDALKASFGESEEMAADVFCNLANLLAGDFLRSKRLEIEALKKTSTRSGGTKSKNALAKQ